MMGWFGRNNEMKITEATISRRDGQILIDGETDEERRTCRDCQKVFSSRNKLMQHLEMENNYEEYGIRETKKERSEREDLLRKEVKLIEERKRIEKLKKEKKRKDLEYAKKQERLLDFEEAVKIYKKYKMDDEIIRVRTNAQNKVEQTVIQGDQITKTEIKDSVISKSNIGAGGKSKAEEIKEIKELLDSDAIDDAEFKQMKKEILGK